MSPGPDGREIPPPADPGDETAEVPGLPEQKLVEGQTFSTGRMLRSASGKLRDGTRRLLDSLSTRLGGGAAPPKEVGRYQPTGLYKRQAEETRRTRYVLAAVILLLAVGVGAWAIFSQTRDPEESTERLF